MKTTTRYFLIRWAPQVLFLGVFISSIYWIFDQTSSNLNRLNQDLGFSFLYQPSGFDINLHLIEYSSKSPVYKAIIVGLLNTLLVSILGILSSTIIGIFIGSLSLSRYRILSMFASTYVQTLRNIPLLAQLIFWYTLFIKIIPDYANSIHFFNLIYLNNRGLALPIIKLPWLVIISSITLIYYLIKSMYHRSFTKKSIFIFTLSLLIFIFSLLHYPLEVSISTPIYSRFNLTQAFIIPIEFFCLLIGLSTYFGAFISEIVRAGVLSIHKTQFESAYALGLTQNQTFKLILMPQSLPLMIPPCLNQYLNLFKASSLAVAIGYPDLVSVFTGTVLNQTGKAIEIISITMMIYLFFNAIISGIINRYNRTQLRWMANSNEPS